MLDYPDGTLAFHYGHRSLECRAFDKLACVDRGQIVDNKRLGTVLRLAQVKQDERENEGKRERSKKSPSRKAQVRIGNNSGRSIPFWQTRTCLWQVQSGRIDHQCYEVAGNGELPKGYLR